MAERVPAGLQSSSRHSRPMQRLAFVRLAAIRFSFIIIAAKDEHSWITGADFLFESIRPKLTIIDRIILIVQ
jgi:hypothetical protein